jgi:hypothetical protein
MQATGVTRSDHKLTHESGAIPGIRLTASERTSLPAAPQPEAATRLGVAFRQLRRPRGHGEQLTEMDLQAAGLALEAFWPKFGTPRPLPERWR